MTISCHIQFPWNPTIFCQNSQFVQLSQLSQHDTSKYNRLYTHAWTRLWPRHASHTILFNHDVQLINIEIVLWIVDAKKFQSLIRNIVTTSIWHTTRLYCYKLIVLTKYLRVIESHLNYEFESVDSLTLHCFTII